MLFMCGFFHQVSNIQKTESYNNLDTLLSCSFGSGKDSKAWIMGRETLTT